MILAVDVSSVTIGWVLGDSRTARVLDGGTLYLTGRTVAHRLSSAKGIIESWLTGLRVRGARLSYFAHEGHVYSVVRHGKHTAPGQNEQNQVLGLVRGEVYTQFGIDAEYTRVIAPNSAKKALTGYGHADKNQMIDAARLFITNADEHCADAVGVYLAALQKIE